MALPKLLQKLFTNGGAGDTLNQDIIPNIPYSKVTDAPSVDSALSATSENPVQNKVINSALDGKLSLTGGTMTGALTAPALWLTSGNTVVGSVRGGLGDYAGLTVYGNQGLNEAWQEGAYAVLRSANAGLVSERGKFALIASLNSSKYISLEGTPDGSLKWGGASVWCGNAKWANRTNLTIGQSFTAPSRGFVYSRGNSTSSWGALHTSVNGITLLGFTGKETDTGGTAYVNAGDTVIVSASGTVQNISAIFVPIN